MLWTAIHLACLTLDCIPQAPEEAFAVIERRRVVAANAAAQAAGVRAGQSLAAALALAPRLAWREREPALEAAALAGLVHWGLGYSSHVVPLPPRGLLIETGGSLKLFGGRGALIARLTGELAAQGFSASLASSPTPTGARMLAESGHDAHPETLTALRAVLPGLPAAALTAAAGFAATFATLGIATVADVLALPRDGLARRFGRDLVDELDRACGRLPDPVTPFVPPDTFRTVIALPAPTDSAALLACACGRALNQLENFLRAGRKAADRIDLALHHERAGRHDAPAACTALRLDFFEPTASAERFARILAERLDRLTLERRVERVAISVPVLLPAAAASASLLPAAGREGSGLLALFERLQARLGAEAIQGMATRPDHRPAHATAMPLVAREPATHHAFRARRADADLAARGPRPVWLVEPPRPLREIGGKPHHDGPLTLIAGPERIESGWWDGAPVARDYFIAQTPARALVWIFRERGLPPGWFLQGVFG
ncbi:MAG: DNA polymerase Y family protein [Burkholderiales bacterium]|nr:DNA polymerase Y family protein [Burkholderiales bacterium]